MHATAVADPLIQTPEGLLTTVTDPKTGKPGYAYPLQTAAWLKMQAVVASAQALPITTANFADAYGTFSDQGTVQTAIANLGKLNTTAKKYGDPQTLISSLTSFQQAGKAPDTIYGHAVWLAAQTQFTAQQIASLLQEGLDEIGKAPDASTRISELTELLTGQGGVTDLATKLKGLIDAFQKAVGDFYSELNPEVTDLQTYLNSSNSVLAHAKGIASSDATTIDALNASIKKLNDQYAGYTTAASVAPVLLYVPPPLGIFLCVADAATFGTLATQTKTALDAAQAQLDQTSGDETKKLSLVAQLGQLNLSVGDVESDGKAFLDAIGTMTAGWTEVENQVTGRLAALTAEDVEDWGAFMTKINVQTALDGWNLVAQKAETFFQAGFVTFETDTTDQTSSQPSQPAAHRPPARPTGPYTRNPRFGDE